MMTSKKPTESDGTSGGMRKFPEPKAWALAWDFQAPVDATGAFVDGSIAGQESAPSGEQLRKFPQPKGWSLEWDGSSVDAIQEFYNKKTDA